jgi:hypothetical protein
MSLVGSSCVALYIGPSAGLLIEDPNTLAGSATSTTWIHGRAIVGPIAAASTLAVALSTDTATSRLSTAGANATTYMVRLTILKIE